MDKKGKIWNKNYILLLQGQLVSTIGDSLYSIALAFFVLKLTGSTALVGMIMGIVTIPRIILGPFAGTIVDRYNRKMLIVWADLIRGISIVAVSFLAYNDMLKVWMLMVVAVIDGVCATFFNPAMETVMPMVVPEDKLVKANSIFGMGQSAADIIGQTAGGALWLFKRSVQRRNDSGYAHIVYCDYKRRDQISCIQAVGICVYRFCNTWCSSK